MKPQIAANTTAVTTLLDVLSMKVPILRNGCMSDALGSSRVVLVCSPRAVSFRFTRSRESSTNKLKKMIGRSGLNVRRSIADRRPSLTEYFSGTADMHPSRVHNLPLDLVRTMTLPNMATGRLLFLLVVVV